MNKEEYELKIQKILVNNKRAVKIADKIFNLICLFCISLFIYFLIEASMELFGFNKFLLIFLSIILIFCWIFIMSWIELDLDKIIDRIYKKKINKICKLYIEKDEKEKWKK